MKFSKISMFLPALVLCCCAFIFSACGDSRLEREAPSISRANIVVTDRTIRIDGFNNAMYSVDRGQNWQDQNTFTNLIYDNTYYVCVKLLADDTYKESPISNVVEIKILKTPATTPTINNSNLLVEGNKLTIQGFSNAMYSKDGGLNWQDSNVFVNLQNGQQYSLRVKIKETETAGASEPSNVFVFQMPKDKQDAPLLIQDKVIYSENNYVIKIEGYGVNVDYSVDNGKTWQDSNVFSDLTPGSTYYVCVRYKETETLAKSDWSKPVVVSFDKVVQNIPTISTLNIQQEGYDLRVIGLENSVAKYSIDGGKTWNADYSNLFQNLQIGTTYFVCVQLVETDTHYGTEMSNVVEYTMQKIEREAPVLSMNNIVQSDYDLTITGFEDYDASYSVNNGETWQTSNVFEGLTLAETYNIKVKLNETEDYLASPESQTFAYTMEKLTRSAPSALELQNITQNGFGIEIAQIEGVEYSIDNGETWQTSNIFENLTISQTYLVTIRYAEDDTYKASDGAVAVEFTMQKLTPQAPVISSSNIQQDMYALVITGFNDGETEYSIDDGKSWYGYHRFDNLSIGATYNVKVRLVENDNYVASEPSNSVAFTMQKLVQLAPTLEITTENIDGQDYIIITPVDGAEYQFDNGEWTEENRLATDCSVSHNVAIRMKETNDHAASDVVAQEFAISHRFITWEFETYPTLGNENTVNYACGICGTVLDTQALPAQDTENSGVYFIIDDSIEFYTESSVTLTGSNNSIMSFVPVLTTSQIEDIKEITYTFVCDFGQVVVTRNYGEAQVLNTQMFTGLTSLSLVCTFNTLEPIEFNFKFDDVETAYEIVLHNLVGTYTADNGLVFEITENEGTYEYLLPNNKVMIGETLQDNWQTLSITNIVTTIKEGAEVKTLQLNCCTFVIDEERNLTALTDGVYEAGETAEISTVIQKDMVFNYTIEQTE